MGLIPFLPFHLMGAVHGSTLFDGVMNVNSIFWANDALAGFTFMQFGVFQSQDMPWWE